LGDVILDVKGNVYKGERSSIALGNDVRFPSGNADNYLGSGAYGVKPYLVFSRRGRVTPNVNLGYQWNGRSVLNLDPTTGTHLRLPDSFFFSGGADVRVTKKLTLVGEFLGQRVLSGSKLSLATVSIPGETVAVNNSVALANNTSYTMDNLNLGFKLNPFKSLFVDASMLLKLDDAGLRSTIEPLVGVAYRF
jgi:hypothetical protein